MPTFSPFLRQCFVTAAVCGNIVGHGCALGYPAVLLPQLRTPWSKVPVEGDRASWIASAMAIPMLFGNFMCPPIMDRLGRKMAHYAVTLPILAGWLYIISADSFEVLLVGRILHGLSFGMFLPLRSVLIGEYTSPKNRGAFLTMVSLAQSLGIFFVHLIGSFLSWQKTALICIFFSFFSLLMTIYSPESPSYLAAKGRFDECKYVFRLLRGENEEKELEEMISAQVSQQAEMKKNNFKEMLITVKKREFYKPIVIMVHAYAMVDFAGGTTMASYSTVIIGFILGKEANVNFWMIFLDGQRIISNSIAVFVINKVPRRVMLISIGSICVFAHFTISAYVYTKNQGIIEYTSLWLPIVLINLHFFTVATGMVPLPSVIAGEIFPLEYRSVGSSISIISVGTVTFLVLKTFPAMTDRLGLEGTYLVYAGALTYFLSVILFMLPETKGKTLQQIEDEFRKRKRKPEEMQLTSVNDEKAVKETM